MPEDNELVAAAQAIVKQMQPNPSIVHEGRIFKPSHLAWLQAIREMRPDGRIGMIDNGSYLRHINHTDSSGFRFDWLDISIDGPETIHNWQRNSDNSFAAALIGIKNAHRILSATGGVHSLLTLTRINYASILETCAILPEEIKQWHITTLTPARPEIGHLVLSDDEFLVSWHQIRQANRIRPVMFRLYVAGDLLKLAKATGRENFLASFQKARVDFSSISFDVDGVRVIYYPQSVSPAETFLLDADTCYRVPYSIAYTLEELTKGISRYDENLEKYTIGKVDTASSFRLLYKKGVAQWKDNFSKKLLQEENFIFKQIQALEERG